MEWDKSGLSYVRQLVNGVRGIYTFFTGLLLPPIWTALCGMVGLWFWLVNGWGFWSFFVPPGATILYRVYVDYQRRKANKYDETFHDGWATANQKVHPTWAHLLFFCIVWLARRALPGAFWSWPVFIWFSEEDGGMGILLWQLSIDCKYRQLWAQLPQIWELLGELLPNRHDSFTFSLFGCFFSGYSFGLCFREPGMISHFHFPFGLFRQNCHCFSFLPAELMCFSSRRQF